MFSRRRWSIYLFAVIAPLAMLALRVSLPASFGERPMLILFMTPIVIAAALGGFMSGVIATVVGGACAAWWLHPSNSFAINYGTDLFQFAVLISNGLLVTVLADRLLGSRSSQQKALASARQMQARFESTFEQAAVGMALVAPDGRWLRVNRKICDIVGYSEAELLRLTFQDITHPDDLEQDVAQVQRMLAREIETYSIEKRYFRKDGSIVWINLTVALAWKTDNTPDYFISVIEDIQARKTAEAALRESQERLRILVDYAPAALAMFDRDLRYLAVSRRWCETYELDDNAIIGAPHYDIFPELSDEWKSVHRRALAGEVVTSNEDRFDRANGVVQWLRWMVRPWHAVDGSVGGIVIFFEDITERKQSEAQLRLWGESFELAHFGLAISDARSNCFIDVNPAFAKMHGYRRDELIGQPVLDVFPTDILPEFKLQLAQLDEHGHQIIESEHISKDGHRFPVLLDITVLKSADNLPTHRVAYVLDITERKHAENALKSALAEAENANAANIAKSAFLANMSHEIRTPINAIMGVSQIMQLDQLTASQRELLDTQMQAGEHLLAIINDILDLSRIEAGKLEINEADIDIDKIVGNVAAMLKPRVHDKGLQLTIDISPLPSQLLGDGQRLQQALLNYLSNAVKFTERGSIAMRVRLVAETEDKAVLHFEVEDSGIGIAPAIQDRLFNAFERADNSWTRKYGGTGLGLAITKRLAKMMGGDVGMHSTQSVGSLFWFTATLSKRPQQTSHDDDNHAANASNILRREFNGRRVLVAEDDPFLQQLATVLLESVGLQTDIAGNGEEALQKALAGNYDLILMDLQMPLLNGIEVTRQLRTHSRCEHIPIIAVTANVFSEDRESCFAAGFDDFLAKPVEPETLFATLLKWLSRERS